MRVCTKSDRRRSDRGGDEDCRKSRDPVRENPAKPIVKCRKQRRLSHTVRCGKTVAIARRSDLDAVASELRRRQIPRRVGQPRSWPVRDRGLIDRWGGVGQAACPSVARSTASNRRHARPPELAVMRQLARSGRRSRGALPPTGDASSRRAAGWSSIPRPVFQSAQSRRRIPGDLPMEHADHDQTSMCINLCDHKMRSLVLMIGRRPQCSIRYRAAAEGRLSRTSTLARATQTRTICH
jgi:hypothetical protein